MLRSALLLLALPVVVAGGVIAAAQRRAAQPPGEPKPQPKRLGQAPRGAGELAILDRQGKPAGTCPLRHTAVSADVAGFVARVSVSQEFHNPSAEPVEAVYTFPLPEDAAVDDMTMTIGDRVIKGQIKRREEARAIYEAARAAGQAAALLDQERPNIFTQSVANIMPRAKVTIAISYVHTLKYDSGQYEFVFPMVVGPRYTASGGYTVPGQRGQPAEQRRIPGDPGARSVVTDPEKITPPITPPDTRAGHDISLAVNLDAGLPIREIKPVLHPVVVERPGENRATIRLKDEKTIPNKDFILHYRVAGDRIQAGALTHSPGGGKGYFTLILQPPLAPPQNEISPKEMVFVIDQTGSQSGWPIEKSKETMRHCIENLNPGDTFQLLAFNTQVYPCFPGPVAVRPDNLDRAWKFLAPLQGNGGTDILKAVDYALKIPDDPGRLRIICYMTDGYVGNDMQIIDYIRKHRGRARMFPFGIGNSVNRFLIEGMARQGRGAAEYVTLNAPGNAAAAKFYERVARPLLLDVRVDWNGMPVADVYPAAIPDVFTAGPIVLKGRYTKPAKGEVTIHGLLRGKPWTHRVEVTFPDVDKDGGAIATLWAREKIEDLQAQDWLGAQTGNPDAKVQEQIVNLALDYRLMTQYTSFVAVEERVINIGGKQRRIDVPVEMPEGVSYEGIFGETGRGAQLGVMAGGSGGAFGGGFASGGMAGSGRGGFGGVPGAGAPMPARRAGPAASRPAGPPGGGRRQTLPPLQMNQYFDFSGKETSVAALAQNRDIAHGTADGLKRLAAMKPDERRALLIQVKLDPAFHGLAEKVKKQGVSGTLRAPGLPEVERGRVTVQIWLNSLPKEGLKQLQAAGFELAATLTPEKLLVGTIPVERLEALLELSFVRRVEPPKFKA